MFKKPFVILDLETSGVDPKKDDIIEVAAIRYENGKEVKRYDSLIKIDYPLPEIITIITSITDRDLEKDGKDKEDVFQEIESIIKGAYIVGHNINFDLSFLQAKGIDLDILGKIDTIPLAQMLIPEATSYSLESLSDDLNILHENKHRAMGDVEATLSLFEHLWKKANELPKTVVDEIQEALPRGNWEGSIFFEDIKGGKKNPPSAPQLAPQSEPQLGIKKPLEISDLFGEGGALSQNMDEYEPRPQQVEMASQVASAFQENYHLICEAPTGVGKSLAYLAAAVHTAISNKSKVVISTNTINLQEQLYYKDVPLLQKIYQESTGNTGFRVAMLKGRSHYLCLRRLAEFKRKPRFGNGELILLIKILVWQYLHSLDETCEIHLTREEVPVWDFELSSKHEHCTPQKCKPYGKCYLHQAREKAEHSDVIIVNHALLCSDLVNSGLLPDYNYLIIDEAHRFEEVATSAMGVGIKQENLVLPIKVIQNHLEDLSRRFEGTLFGSSDIFEAVEPLLADIPDMLQYIDNFFNVIALFVNRNVQESAYIENLLIDRVIVASEEWINLSESFADLNSDLRVWMEKLRKIATTLELSDNKDFPEQDEFTDELIQEIMILQEQLGHVSNFFDEEHKGKELIRWAMSDMSGVINIHMAPLMLGPNLKEKLYDKKKSIILTSATLGVQLKQNDMDHSEQHPFTYLRNILGLDESFEEVILDSPYDFESQTYVITPSDLLPLTARNSITQISDFIKNLIRTVGGGMLGLFTAYNALENVYLNLMQSFTANDPKVLAQRLSGGRNKIFKAYMNDPQNSVLLGTNSFWEGVDIQGEALKTLIIHKLPFDVPSDPIIKARSQLFANSFYEYSVPRAILRFRQGFGRLIRSKKDYGVLIILDNRVITKEFGRMFLQSLPEGITQEKLLLSQIPEKVKEWFEVWKK